MINHIEYLYEEIKNFVTNVGWTHKIQMCQVDIYTKKSKIINRAKIILTSLTSVGVGSFILDYLPTFEREAMIATFIISVFATIIIAFDKETDYKHLSEQNKSYADKYLEMRNASLDLLYKMKLGDDISEIRRNFTELKEMRKNENINAPYTSPKAVHLASKKLKENRDNDYSNDYELFIPVKLLNLEDRL